MTYRTSRTTILSFPYTTSSPGFQPSWIEFECGPKNGSSTNVARFSGSFDGTRMNYISVHSDSTSSESVEGGNKMLRVRERISGTIQDAFTIDTCTFSATGYTLTGSGTGYSNYPITVKCGD